MVGFSRILSDSVPRPARTLALNWVRFVISLPIGPSPFAASRDTFRTTNLQPLRPSGSDHQVCPLESGNHPHRHRHPQTPHGAPVRPGPGWNGSKRAIPARAVGRAYPRAASTHHSFVATLCGYVKEPPAVGSRQFRCPAPDRCIPYFALRSLAHHSQQCNPCQQ